MILREELLKIGQFNKPHGIKGELSATFTDTLFEECEPQFVVCERDGIFVPFFVDDYRFRGASSALIKLADIESDDDARPFTNLDIYISKEHVEVDDEELAAPGDYFIGFTAADVLYGELGKIVEVDDSTENTLFIIEGTDGEELLIPANDDLVVSLDEEKRILLFNIPEGLLDLQG